jgi:hypothetical protein
MKYQPWPIFALRTLQILTHLIPTTATGRKYDYTHFQEQEI